MSDKLKKIAEELGDVEVPLTIKLVSAEVYTDKPELDLKDTDGISVKYELQLDPNRDPFELGFNVASSAADVDAINNTLKAMVIHQLHSGFQKEMQVTPDAELSDG